jgi:hypothetical protein
MLSTHVADVFEVFWKAVNAVLACTFSAPVLFHERGRIDDEQGVPAKYHVLRKRPKLRSVARPREGGCVGTVLQADVMVTWYIVHRELRCIGEDRMEARDVLLVSITAA